MATTSITPVLYKTYVTNYQSDHGYEDTDLGTGTNYYMGYTSSTMNSNNKMYCSVFKLTMPSSSYASSIESFTITPTITMFLTGTLAANKYWYFTLHSNATETYWACGDHTHEEYSTNSGRTQRATNSSSLSGSGASTTLGTMTFSKSAIAAGNSSWMAPFIAPGQSIYLYCYSGIASISSVKVGLTCSVTYTPTTYYATKGTCTYATASVTPTSGTYGTSFTLTASSYANDDNYIYGGLTYTYGSNAGGGVNSPYASGYGAKQTITNSGTYSSDFTYTASASRYTADPAPNDVTCTVSNVTSSSARITVPSSGITTTFLGDYYYITVTDCNNIAGSLTGSTRFSRSTGYVNLTGLTSGTTHKMYIYAYNSYNERYYKISTVEFKIDQSSYSATITSNVTGSTSATVSMSNLSSTTNLDSYWYLVKSNAGSTATSISNYFRQNRGSAITLSNTTTPALSPASSITLYAYVKSSVSGTYYRVGSITMKTHSYIYYTDNNGNLIPCWTYMLIDGNWTQVVLDVPGYRT